MERNFRTLRTRFLDRLDSSALESIDKLNQLLNEYIRKHNTSVHSATDKVPYNRYMEDMEHVKMPKSREWLDECFLHRVKRKVANDSTVLIDKHYYDVPMEFIRTTVEVRYLPGDTTSAFVLYDNKRYPVKLTDKVANSKTKRNNSYTVNYGKEQS